MTLFDKDSIKYLSKLSRIHCTEEEEEALLSDLAKIVKYINQLDEVDTTDIEPCIHILTDVTNVMREDSIKVTLSQETFLANAPSHTGGRIRIPSTFTEG